MDDARAVLGAMLLAGCSSAKEYTFDVSVKNESGRPITLWLTKDGPPMEEGWRSPEQVAMQSPGHEERISGVLVPDGKTASYRPDQREVRARQLCVAADL